MLFDLEKFFIDIFKPRQGNEVVTVMYDLPHGDIKDNLEWKERREMAEGRSAAQSGKPFFVEKDKAGQL